MALIHLLNEIVSHRELAAESWTNYLSFSVEETTGAILAETFAVYHNAQRPYRSSRERIGQQRISYNKAPFSLAQPLRLLEDIIPAQQRDTTSLA
jgi:hypothetical protein